MAVEGERFIHPKSVVLAAHGRGAKVNIRSIRKLGEGLVVQYVLRHEGIEGREYRVAVINSRGLFAGTMMVQ